MIGTGYLSPQQWCLQTNLAQTYNDCSMPWEQEPLTTACEMRVQQQQAACASVGVIKNISGYR